MRRFCLFIACMAMVFSVCAAKKVTWVIDAGHGGHDVGCEGQRAREKDITLAVAKEVGRLVKKNISGVRIVYTREKDTFLTLQERCDIANARGAALFISIHVNSAENQFARGTESFFATNVPLRGTQAGKSELLALLLQRQYLAHGRQISRGVKQRELYVCEHTNMPSVLTEVGFISNLNEEAYLTSKEGQQELATAIYQALCEWKDLTKNGTVAQRDLRNLRVTHYAPLRLTTVETTTCQPTPPETEADRKAEEEEVVKDNAAKAQAAQNEKARQKAKEKEQEKEKEEEQEKAQEQKETTHEVQPEATPTATDTRPYFSIQLMNTATELKEGDYRLKGFKAVRNVPAGGRFKILYGRSENYKEIKNELVQVRETFPEAFIVAFLGDKQITTAEALELLKK